jgi:hypothetical protein
MQRLFNLLASATIIILLGVIFWPKTTVSARIIPRVDSMSEIDEALEGFTYDRLSYDGTNGIFKIHYNCTGPGL